MMYLKRRCIILTDSNGKAYVVDGKLHREEGPAIECANGNKAWYLKGQKISEMEHRLATGKDENYTDEFEGNKIPGFWEKVKNAFGDWR